MSEEPINKKGIRSTVLWLILFFPVGLYKMWKGEVFDVKVRVGITGAFVVLFAMNYSENYEKYKNKAIQQNVGSMEFQLNQTRKNANMERISEEIRETVQGSKSIYDYLVKVEHISWQGHDILVCNINDAKGACGLYEVIETSGHYQAHWLNGKAKGRLGHKFSRSPSSIDPAQVLRSVSN